METHEGLLRGPTSLQGLVHNDLVDQAVLLGPQLECDGLCAAWPLLFGCIPLNGLQCDLACSSPFASLEVRVVKG